MAFLGVLPEAPSFGTQLARGLGAGLGSGISQGTQLAFQLMGERRKKIAKDVDRLGKVAKPYLKEFGPSFLADQERYHDLIEKAEGFIEQGYSPEDALHAAMLLGKERSESQEDLQETPYGAGRASSEHPFGLAGEYLEPALKAVKKKPSLLATELPGAIVKSGEALSALHDPFSAIVKAFSSNKRPEASEMLSEKLRSGLPEELKPGAERIGDIESFLADLAIPIPGLKGVKGLPKAAEKFVASAAEKEAPKVEAKAGEALAERVGKVAETEVTQLRMNRMAPESRIYKTGEQSRILKEQLSNYPKYAAEIAADAEHRAARLNRVLGPKAMATRESRMALAEAEIPRAKKSYETAIARVRALEEEMAKLPEKGAERVRSLYEAAVKELEDSEFFLRQMLSNAKTGESKVGLDQMRKAAQEKLLRISDEIAAGEEVKLAKSDYNPEFIKRANELSRKKPLPSTKTDDFYTQVHDEYAKQYASRLAQLQEQIKAPVRSMADAEAKRLAIKEADALQKMINSAQAENTIHRHNLALREMNQRKLASERLATKTTTLSKEPKVERTAQAKMWKGRFEEARTPQERSAVIDEAIEKIAADNPKLSGEVQKEAPKLKSALEELERLQAPKVEGKSPKDASNTALKYIKEFHRKIEDMLGKIPVIGKHWIGRDLIIGAVGAFADELHRETKFPLTAGDITNTIFGRPGAFGVRYLVRKIGKSAVRWAIKESKTQGAVNALRKGDDKKFLSYPKSVQKEAFKEIRG